MALTGFRILAVMLSMGAGPLQAVAQGQTDADPGAYLAARAAGLATEVDTALALGRLVARQVGLAAETDADSEGTAEDRKRRQRHVDCVERGERDEHQQAVKDQRADGRCGVFAESESFQKTIGKHARREARHDPADYQDRQARDRFSVGDRLAVERHQRNRNLNGSPWED